MSEANCNPVRAVNEVRPHERFERDATCRILINPSIVRPTLPHWTRDRDPFALDPGPRHIAHVIKKTRSVHFSRYVIMYDVSNYHVAHAERKVLSIPLNRTWESSRRVRAKRDLLKGNSSLFQLG